MNAEIVKADTPVLSHDQIIPKEGTDKAASSDFNLKPTTTSEHENGAQKTQVASFYNAVPEVGVAERTQSRIFYLRNFNNWAKSMLIGDAIQRVKRELRGAEISVLDMCCGKGGDLLKWKKGEIDSLVCADIADVSLDQCRTRYMEMIERNNQERRPQKLFTCEFYNADLTKMRLKDLLSNETQFDLCSCQFSLHYCFESETQARCMLQNACERLKPGAYFIGTILNDNLLVNICRKTTNNSYSNEVCSIKFELESMEEGKIPIFGAKYHFTLDQVVNLPEYLVHMPLLIELLKEFDMEFVYLKSFPELVKEKAYSGEGRSLLGKMQSLEPFPPHDGVELIGQNLSEYMHAESVFEDLMANTEPGQRRTNLCVGTLSKSEWEVARMYSVFMFRKRVKND